jgi:DNA-directed RNA polymerase beta' subunit
MAEEEASKNQEKHAAYIEGFYSRAAEYGLNEKEASAVMEVVKNIPKGAKNVKTLNRIAKAKKYAPYVGGALAAGAAGTYALSGNKDEDEDEVKTAAYIEGFIKRASAYGLSETQISSMLNQL